MRDDLFMARIRARLKEGDTCTKSPFLSFSHC